MKLKERQRERERKRGSVKFIILLFLWTPQIIHVSNHVIWARSYVIVFYRKICQVYRKFVKLIVKYANALQILQVNCSNLQVFYYLRLL